MSRDIKDLIPALRTKVQKLLSNCLKQEIRMVPYDTLRSPWEQAKYWRQSRATGEIRREINKLRSNGAPFLASVLESVGPQFGRHVTNALPGNSWHQWGEGMDCFWEVEAGTAEWSTTRLVNGKNGYRVYADEADRLGLDAGGHWSRFKDWPHVQLRKDADPRRAGMSWPEIDREMRERFGVSSESFDVPTGFALDARAGTGLVTAYVAPEGWRVHRSTDASSVVFRAKMSICADGAPKAYHANDSKALDYLANAGRPGNWWGIVTEGGTPVVQGRGDPAPGYYVSTTALNNPGFAKTDPARYVDATRIPYIVLPLRRYTRFHQSPRLRLSDVGVAYNTANGLTSFVQFAELGPSSKIGEGSIALADALGINSNAKNGGTSRRQVVYVVFPGTGPGHGLGLNEIENKAGPLFDAWGGLSRLAELGDLD